MCFRGEPTLNLFWSRWIDFARNHHHGPLDRGAPGTVGRATEESDHRPPHQNVLAGRYRPLRPGLLSAECEDLLGRMLVPRPADRITLAEVAQHPWVARVDDLPPAAPPRSAP